MGQDATYKAKMKRRRLYLKRRKTRLKEIIAKALNVKKAKDS